MDVRKPSCEVALIQEPPKPKSELEQTAERLGITPAKLDAMRKYAVFLRKSEPRIKESTVRKRILEKFKIKLV